LIRKHCKRRKHVQFMGIGTADNSTGYVLPLTVNYDPSLDPTELNKQAEEIGDTEKELAFRQFGHYWLDVDYKKALGESRRRDKKKDAIANKTDRETRLEALQEVIEKLEEKYDVSFSPSDINEIFASQKLHKYDNALLKEAKEEVAAHESENVLIEIMKAYNQVLDRIDTEISEHFDEARQLPKKWFTGACGVHHVWPFLLSTRASEVYRKSTVLHGPEIRYSSSFYGCLWRSCACENGRRLVR